MEEEIGQNRLIPDCIRAWTNRDPVKVRNPSSTRPWQHVLEPLGGYLLLAKKIDLHSHLSGEAFNFGPMSEENKTVLQVLDTSKNFFDDVNFDIHKDENTNFKEANLLKLNCDKALETINWKPILNFDETIKMTFDWYKKFYETGSMKKLDIYKFTISQINEYYEIAETKKGRMDTRNLNFSYKKVSIKKLNEISTNGGNILKYLDKEHTNFVSFGETYFSCINFDFIKGWKRHKKATLNIAVLVGEIKFVIFDDRKKKLVSLWNVLSRKRFNL